MHDRGSTNRLMPQHAALFVDNTLFHKLARTVCEAGVLPRKELYESWEVARRSHRRFRGHRGRIIDWACGHGLMAHALALLFEDADVIAWDIRMPPSATTLQQVLRAQWPRLSRVQLATTAPILCGTDLVVSCHACGPLTDDVLSAAMEVGAHVVVLPCCQDIKTLDDGGLNGWLEPALAIDVTRAHRLRSAGYQVHTQSIPADVTPKNRLLLAVASAADGGQEAHKPW
jgi:Methyltransferase domain